MHYAQVAEHMVENLAELLQALLSTTAALVQLIAVHVLCCCLSSFSVCLSLYFSFPFFCPCRFSFVS